MGVAESKLRGDGNIELPGYKYFAQNRQLVHIRAGNGSGGAGLFVKNDVLEHYNACI